MTAHDCPGCGDRCDRCGDRMCAEYGPEPAPSCGAHVECVECATDARCDDCERYRAEGDTAAVRAWWAENGLVLGARWSA